MFIAADAPRNSEEEELVQQSKAITEQIDWPCEVLRKYETTNLGCALGPANAISWAFTYVEELIILEDDCVPHIDFFNYAQTLLEKYRFDNRVGIISGTCLPNSQTGCKWSYYYSRLAVTWGWATWKRVWEQYDFNIADWEYLSTTDWLTDVWSANKYYINAYQHMFNAYRNGYDVWDTQFFYLCLKNNYLNIHPTKNLISNIGYDVRATHTHHKTAYSELKTEAIGALIHPPYMAASFAGDASIFEHLYGYKKSRNNKAILLYRKLKHKLRQWK
ncbi:MAG: nucleotide-diphospho-sugar transferase [Chitinophagaceae bacterium]|nr:nucleotide-diphospho-sugar transferase [Chitinophagaceae bacterium]